MLPSHDPLPLYFRVARDLEQQIASKKLRPGEVLPTEEQLCVAYAVSRITVRRALDELSAKRLVVRRRGVGTFVSDASYSNRLSSMVPSIHDALSYGGSIVFEQMSRGVLPASEAVAAALRIPVGEPVDQIVRLGRVDGEAISVTEIYLPPDIGALLSARDGKSGNSVIQIIEARLGHPLPKAEQTVEAEAADARLAKALGLKARAPLLRITRVYFSEVGRPVEMAVVRYHPQRYQFNIELVRSGSVR